LASMDLLACICGIYHNNQRLFPQKKPQFNFKQVEGGTNCRRKRQPKNHAINYYRFFYSALLVPSIDHHFRWSNVPSYLSILADFFVVLGLFFIFLFFRENTYTSVLIEVNEDQKVVSTGPYGVVRHPMYSGALILLLFTPLALGSFWGLLAFPPILLAIAVRLNEEERFLDKNLTGYKEYRQIVRYRLIPFIW
jgi:protein-S-isoprenylcysteine O-methyltransferase Ste14